MPRNHGHTALLANWTVHSKIRTILKILTILSILQSSLSQERSNKDNDKDYVVEWDDAYGLPARLSIFVKGDDNETSDTSLSKETLEGSKERRYSRWWKEEEEKSRREEDLWRKDVNKAGLMALEVNTVKRTIGQEYLDWRSFKERTIEGMEDVKENEENERTKERGDNEESSRSKEDRNSNNFMTKPGTPRNRETDGDWVEERSKGGRSSWILRGASIKRSIREDATRGEVFRKDEMSFSTASELDDDLRRTEGEKRRRRRRERKRRRRETNSSFELDEWKASNRSVLEKRKVRINVKEKKSLRGEVEETKKEKEIKTDEKEEDTKFITTISSRDEWQEEKGWIERLRKKNRNVVESFGENLWERDEKSNASLGTIVDNFSEDTTLSYLSKKVRKSTQRKEDAPNRVGSSKDSEIPSWYRDNTPLAGKAIGFRSRKETEDKNRMTTRRGNLSRDKVQKEQTNVDLKPREKNVLVTTQRSRLGTERLSKEFSNSPELATVPSGTIKYMKRDENWIARSGISDGNESFSTTTTATLLKNVSQGKENEKDRDDRGGEILSTTPIYFSRGQKEKNSAKDMKDGKEGVSRSVGNISENTGVYRNSTYPNHDTFDSSWVYSTGLPIVESNGREAVVESSKDSERNVGDSVESSESPKLFETSPLPRFPIVSIVRDRELVKENSRREHHGVVQNREKVQRYKEDEKLVKTLSKKYQGVTPNTRDSRIDKKKAEENTTETISPEYFPRSTSLTNSEITSSSWMIEVKEEESAQKAEDRKVSDYEKEINDTARDPLKEYKFELRESTVEFDATSAVSPTTLDDIREKLERNYGREEKDRKVERLKEEESLNPTILSKSKRSKSIKITSKYSIPSGRTKEDEKSGVGNQETKTDESFDPISNSHENVRTSVLRRNTTETTVETSVERTSTNGPLDRSISFTGVEIEGITNTPPLFDVSSQFPFDLFNTIVSTSIGENVSLSDITERSTIPWEETTTYNVSSKQPIGSTPNTTNLDQWPVKHSAVVEGDLVLGGLMMVHEREDTITCGPVMPQGGVQALEAMLYTLDTLNQREIVPGVKIGAHILDDCDKDTYGLEMAVDFIKGSISNIDGAEYHCNKTTVRKVISGVVGAASSVTSIQVANLLRLFRIPQVSFFSTSPELSNKQRFEYFTRTIPSDHYQVKAMVDIVLKMGWSYVSIIYEESNYGIKAFEELEELLTKNDICIAIKEKLVKDSGVAEETAYDNIVLKLLTKPRAKGCIIFGSDQEVAGVMRAVRRCNATGAFSWIGSDGWSARGLVSNGNEAEVEGTLSVQPQANPVRGFEEYFLNLTVENNRRNPWFVEFWEDHFQCRYPNSSSTPYNKKYTKVCSTKERLTKENTVFEDQLQFVSDAVMAFAYAFRDMHKDLCGGKAGLCDTMKPTKGTELLRYLRKVNFEGLSGDKFRFDKNGDGPARYNIIHFKQTEPGVYKWIRVGKYLEGVLHLNMSMVQFKLGHNQTPESVCSLPCEVGQAKKYVEGESCCWHCFNCSQYQIRHPDDETQCKNCRQGTVPDETHSTCRDIPEEFLRLESGWAIGAMSFSAIGILVTLFVCGVFLKHNDTPVVRASGRELSYVLLTGILLCYLVTFALVLRPTDLVCSIQRFGAGFCFTVVYAALLTKTNRISRIFNAGKHSAKRPSFISPRSQLIICSGLVGVQILVNGVWIVIDPAKAMHHYPTKEDNLLVCNSYIDASYMIAFTYPIILIVVCTVYAVLTRKIPEAFNESKYIGFTMYTTCVIWLAFVPLYFGTGNHVALRITSMSVTISLSASVTIACLFTPKLYIILIRPERNVRQNIMPPRPYNTTKSSAVTGTNASSMMAPVTLTAVTCDQNKAVKKHIITTMDCSTQSEYYELEVKEMKNGRTTPSFVSRATQTQSNNNEKEPNDSVHHVDKESKDNARQTNNTKIGNGPVNQNDVTL